MNLIEAVINNDALAVKSLLIEGADPNACLDEANITPLHFAAQHNAIDVVELLLTAGADIHARSFPDGQTALDIAKLHGHREMVNLLAEFSNKIP